MSRRLLALNLLLAAATVVFSVQLARVLSTPRPLSPPSGSSASPANAALKDDLSPPRPALAAYSVVATKNLFNPNRSEVVEGASLGPAAKPVLYGVVIDRGTRLAYIEDPATKRVFGYKTGDAVAGGQLEQIEEDRVVIKRPEGPLEVKLRDPSKPKPVASAPKPPQAVAPRAGVQPVSPIAPPVPAFPSPAPPRNPRLPGPLHRPQGAAGAPGMPVPSQ